MAFPIEKKLVIAVSSSALFQMTDADAIFRKDGEVAYRQHQRDNVNNPFQKGVAFPFIKRLMALNKLYPEIKPVEVIVLSRNDPDSGRRFFHSAQHYGLAITRGAFLTGKSTFPYIPAFNASLFLSSNQNDVKGAIDANLPAGLVLPTSAKDDEEDIELRVAFDFDGVLADDEAEKVYHATGDVDLFQHAEMDKVATPHNPGPLKDLIIKMAFFQQLEMKKASENKDYKPALRIAIVTARDAPANERLVTTLNAWGLTAIEAFFLGGIEKSGF